ALQPNLPPDGLPRGPQGIHGRGRRRHRQHPRGDARRAARRPGRVLGEGLPERQRLRPRRVRDPDRDHARPPERSPGHPGAAEGLGPVSTTPNPPNPGTPGEADGPIGVDQWVAQADERREELTGVGGRIVHLWRLLPPAGKLALITPAIAVPFLPFVSQGNLFNYGIFILIYALLALGLNVVVGYAGLLDLGYVAFFGFGAYTYAFLSGTHSEKGHVYTHHWPAELAIPVAGVLCGRLGGVL